MSSSTTSSSSPQSDTIVPNYGQVYESDMSASQYNEFHYGPKDYYGVANFNKVLAELCTKYSKEFEKPKDKVLDLGCAVGRASFELARYFDKVIGIDYSHNFVKICNNMKRSGSLKYKIIEEGELTSERLVSLADSHLDIGQNICEKVEFYQGDACALEPQFADFDLILAANLICRLHDPRHFLSTIHERIKVGGLLVIASPFTMMEEYTKKELWFGGYYEGEKAITGFEGISKCLEKHFKLLKDPTDVEFVIRETRRKFQHTMSQVTVWERTN